MSCRVRPPAAVLALALLQVFVVLVLSALLLMWFLVVLVLLASLSGVLAYAADDWSEAQGSQGSLLA